MANKLKKFNSSQQRQETLFDNNGYVHFCPEVEIKEFSLVEGKYIVGDMRMWVQQADADPKKAIALVVESLVLLRAALKKKDNVDYAFGVEQTNVGKCKITYRAPEHGCSVRVVYFKPGDRLELSLPSPREWEACGLGWLNIPICCDLEEENPMPWLGKRCECSVS